VVGKWKRTFKRKGVQIVLEPFLEIDSLEERVHEAIMRYCAFVDLPLLSSEVLQ
jgi:hypothetical protein